MFCSADLRPYLRPEDVGAASDNGQLPANFQANSGSLKTFYTEPNTSGNAGQTRPASDVVQVSGRVWVWRNAAPRLSLPPFKRHRSRHLRDNEPKPSTYQRGFKKKKESRASGNLVKLAEIKQTGLSNPTQDLCRFSLPPPPDDPPRTQPGSAWR